MEKVVYSHLGLPSRKMKVGPGRGLDNAVVSLGRRRVLVVTVDPVSVIPALGMKLSAWLSVHLIASDLTASGVDPEFATFSYNFPPELAPSARAEYVSRVGEECKNLGVTIVAGNTGTYPGGGFTVIGAGTMFGLGSEGGYVTPSMAREGDSILITKQAAVEATASLALSFKRYLAEQVGKGMTERACRMVKLCTTVADARAARRAGLGSRGVTSMHDATEGGVLGALDEMAWASKKAFVVDPGLIPVSEEATQVCASFGINPLMTMSEGALLITCNPRAVPLLEHTMTRADIPVREIGKVKEGNCLLLSRNGGRPTRPRLSSDRYWEAYEQAARGGLPQRRHLI